MHIHDVATKSDPPAPRKKMGAPTSYCEATVAEICRRLALGDSLTSICKTDGMPDIGTVYDWRARHDDFDQRYARARSDQADTMAEATQDLADEEPERDEFGKIDNGWVQRQKLRIDARKWRAGVIKPKVYGAKQALEHTGSDGGPILVVTGVPKPPPPNG